MSVAHLSERRRSERVSFAFPARTSTGIIGEVVNFSRTGIRLALDKPLLSNRTMPIQIDFPFSSPLKSFAEIVWNRSYSENNRFLCGVRFLRLKDNEEVILNEAIGQYGTLDSKFVFYIIRMRDWLIDFKAKCDKVDRIYSDDFNRIEFVEKNKFNLETTLDIFFKNIWKTVENIIPEDYNVHLRYYWDMLGSYLVDSIEVGRFVHGKPLGYVGDFMLMNYFYDYIDKYLGESTYEKSIHSYGVNISTGHSLLERKRFFKQKIVELLTKKDSVKILSVASGSARELIDLVENGKITKPLYFDCLDVEPEAFAYIHDALENIRPENKNNLHMRFIKADFLDLIRGKEIPELFKKYDFIYSSGLFDYLNDRLARKLIYYLFELLEPDSSLIITNARKDDIYRAYYEMLGGWKLIRRDEKEMLDWAREITGECFSEIVNLRTNKPFMFLILALHKTYKLNNS